MKIGIVIADEFEFEPFSLFARAKGAVEDLFHGRKRVAYTENGKTIQAVQCGIGKTNAAAATAFLIADGAEVILNAGLSGAIHGLRRGDIVAGESFRECDFDLTAIGRAPGEKPEEPPYFVADKKLLALALSLPGVKKAALGTGDLFLADKEKSALFRSTFGIASFDMETAAIASVCYFSGIPFGSLRQISDDADDAAQNDYRQMNDQKKADLTELLSAWIEKL